MRWRAQNSFPGRKSHAHSGGLLVLQLTDQRAQLNDLERTLAPVMLPAHDHIATGGVVAVVQEIAAGIFELDPNPLPALVLAIDAPGRFAVRVNGLKCFYNQSQVRTHHAE